MIGGGGIDATIQTIARVLVIHLCLLRPVARLERKSASLILRGGPIFLCVCVGGTAQRHRVLMEGGILTLGTGGARASTICTVRVYYCVLYRPLLLQQFQLFLSSHRPALSLSSKRFDLNVQSVLDCRIHDPICSRFSWSSLASFCGLPRWRSAEFIFYRRLLHMHMPKRFVPNLEKIVFGEKKWLLSTIPG